LLDMLRFHHFGAARRWTQEYGSPDDPAQFRALHAYSPYHRVRPGSAYPALLLMSGEDDRVDPLHARKFAAAVQAASPGGRPVLLRVQRSGGHGGADVMAQRIAAEVDELSFLMSELGMNPGD
jgi:prolyl oligopeptidase